MAPVQHLATPLQVLVAGLQARVLQLGVFQSTQPPQQKLSDTRCTYVQNKVPLRSVRESVDRRILPDAVVVCKASEP